MQVRIQVEHFDFATESAAFLAGREDQGALASFLGTVRSTPDNLVESLTLEHYPELAEKQITRIAEAAVERFVLTDVLVVHRFGTLKRGEPIVLVLTLAEHRKAAFDAIVYIMDWLKTDAPFWKFESGPDGGDWVTSRAEDYLARKNWGD